MGTPRTPVAEYHDREAWLAARQKHLTASEIMAVVGRHPFLSGAELARRKLGLADPVQDNANMKRGRLLEPIAADLWSEQTGLKVKRVPFKIHKDRPLFACSADRQVLAGTDVEGKEWPTSLLEVKVPGWQSFSKMRREGLPDYIIGQIQMQGAIHGYDHVHVSVLHADSLKLLPLDGPVPVDYEFTNHLFDLAEEWWDRHVVNGEPVLEVPHDIDLPEVQGELVTISDAAWVEAAEAVLDARDIRKEAEAVEAQAKDALKALMEKYGAYEGGAARVYYQRRPGRVSFQRAALQKAQPLDKGAVQEFLMNVGNEEILNAFIALLPELEVDFQKYEKVGSSYEVLTPYRITPTEF